MESFSTVIEDEENQVALQDLIRQLRSPIGIIPFIGAGMSAPDFPGWTKLLLDNAKKNGIEEKVKQHVDAGQYEEAAQVLEDTLGENGFHHLIRQSFGDHKLKDSSPNEAVDLLPGITSGPVITTNFDRVLERVFRRADWSFERVVKGAEIDTFGKALDLNLHLLLKVHGDAEDRTHRTLTYREYERSYGARLADSRPLLANQLEQLAIRGRFLFLGCSLEQDRLMEVLARINKTYQGIEHYALLQRPNDPASMTERRKFLFDRCITPIWFPEGKFQNIPIFLRHLIEQRSSSSRSRIGEELADRERALLKRSSMVLVGRETELRQLDEYANSQSEFIQVVTGNPGMGKTGLLAKWVTEQLPDKRIGYHFFSERSGLTSVRDAYLHLLYQLSNTNPDIQTEELVGADEEKLRYEFYNLIKNLRGTDRLTIVLDGLDEAERPFLPPFPLPLPAGLRVIVSARSGATEYLDGWKNGTPPLMLEPLVVEAVGSWLRKVGNENLAKCADDKNFLQTLWQRTGGFPLYLHYLFDELIAAAETGQSPQTIITQRPAGFAAYVRDQLSRLAKQENGLSSEVKKIFALLSVALGAISESDLEELTGMTVFDLPALPPKITRWFDIRTHTNGTVTWAFGHPELAREFAPALGKLARDMEKKLISYCQHWAENGSRYALEYLADHLVRTQAYAELFNLACDNSFFSFHRRAFPDDPQASLKTVRTALSAASNLNDAAAMARFALLQARRILELRAETPIDVLRAGSLSRVWQLADLYEPPRAILWHMLVAAELQKEDIESAIRTLLRLEKRNLVPLSDWYGVAAAGLLLPLAETGTIFHKLSRRLLPGFGQTVEVVSAISNLAQRLVERGLYDLATNVGYVRKDTVRVAVVRHRAGQGDFDGAEKEIKKILSMKLRAEAGAELAVHVSGGGDSQRAHLLLAAALEDVKTSGGGEVEVAIQLANFGYLKEALSLVNLVEDKSVYVARGLTKIAVSTLKRGDDPSPLLERLEQLVVEETDKRWKPVVLAELAVAYLRTGREPDVHKICDTLLQKAGEGDAASIEGVIAVAGAYAGIPNAAEAERLFGVARERASNLESDSSEMLGKIANAEADAGLFTSAMQTLSQMSSSGWRDFAWRDVVVNRAAAGEVAEALNMLDFTNHGHKESIAEIASNLLATGKWQEARRIFVDLFQSSDEQRPWQWPKKDSALARMCTVLAGQKQTDDARALVDRIIDAQVKASALRDVAIAQARAGDFPAAIGLALQIEDEYQKQKALGGVALEQSRQGDSEATATLKMMNLGSYLDWSWALELVTLLKKQDALGLIDEFRLFQESEIQWYAYGDPSHMQAIKLVALVRAGDFKAALAEANHLSGRAIIASFEKITPIAIKERRLAEVIATVDDMPYSQNAAKAFVGIGLAQIKENLLSEGLHSLERALAKIPEINETSERQKTLVEVGVAYEVAGKKSDAANMWKQAFQLESQYRREAFVAPLEVDDVTVCIVKGLATAGLWAQALDWIHNIDDLNKRGSVLAWIAEGFTPGGEFSRQVLRVAQEVVLRRDSWIPQLIDVLVRIKDVDNVKLAIGLAADSMDAAFEVCGALAELYPEQASAIAAVVLEQPAINETLH